MERNTNDEKLTLLLGVHDHQPVGNFDFVFDYATDTCYSRFVDALLDSPRARWTLHISGPLLLWLTRNRPELLEKMRTLLDRGQVELLGSGLSEAVLATIPPRDLAWQVEEMQQLAEQTLGVAPRGIWLTERVWEPGLPALLAPLGIEYTFVDDHHFACAGFEKENLGGYYVVEKHGHALKVFPISSDLRYLIPFQPLDDVFGELEAVRRTRIGRGSPTVLSCLDDGEKFGLWPDTADWVYEKGWLAGFLSGLDRRADTISTALPSEIIDGGKPEGRAALPTCSYREMTEWALPVPAIKRMETLKDEASGQIEDDLRGGFWDNFYTKYEESNRMHKRMLWSSGRLSELETKVAPGTDAERHLTRARLSLMMGQCNDAYWHGLFGGLYFPFLRAEIYKQLINADLAMDEIEPALGTWRRDLDADGLEEWIARTRDQMLVVKPAGGGCVCLWEDHGIRLNLTDVLTRREEAYHERVAASSLPPGDGEDTPSTIHDIERCKEEGLQDRLIYDDRTRLLGRVFATLDGPEAEALRLGEVAEIGGLSLGDFEISAEEDGADGHSIDLAMTLDGSPLRGTLRKRFTLAPSGVSLRTDLWLDGEARDADAGTEARFVCVEMNLTINALDEHRRIRFGKGAVVLIDGQHTGEGERTVRIEDDYRPCSLSLESSVPARFAVYPIETVSASESGFERIFQGICVTVGVPVEEITGGRKLTVTITRD